MYRQGHYGMALLVYAPVGFGLLFIEARALALLGGVLVLALARLPDYDLRVPFLSHRGSTHTVTFALLVGLIVCTGALLVARPAGVQTALIAGGFGLAVGTLSVLSHLLADVITPAGITPLWPLSKKHYSLGWVRADNTLANWGLLGLGVFLSVTLLVVGVSA